MTLRAFLLTFLAAVSPMLTGCSGEDSSAPPPVERLARQLARPGARSVIVFVSAGDKEYVATGGALRPEADQRFRVGSVTKTFTATIVLQLVEERTLLLSSTLDDHLPGMVPRGNEITIRQLLSHRSGLVDYTDHFSWLKRASRSTSRSGLGMFSADVRCGRSWGHNGWILDNVTLVRASEEGDRVGVISVRSSRAIPPFDESALVCPESRLSESAKDSRIAFVRTPRWGTGRQRRSELHVVNADGSEQRWLTFAAWPETPVWSPDGGRIAFEGRRDGNPEIYVMNADGSGQRNLTRNAEHDVLPAWSPDGQTIAFMRGRRGESWDVYAMNADGSGQRRLTRSAARDNAPAWSPDGRMIAFESRRDGAGNRGR